MTLHSASHRRLAGALVFVSLVAGFVASVAAQAQPDDQTRAAARELAQHGIDAFKAGDYADANQKLDKAFRLFAAPTLGLWSARARVQLGLWVEAAERYREALRASTALGDLTTQQQAQSDAAEELAALTPRIPAITLELDGGDLTDVSLTLDGAKISAELLGVRLPVNPGAHRVVAVSQSDRSDAEVQLSEKEHKHVPLSLRVSVVAAAPTPVQTAESAATPSGPLVAGGPHATTNADHAESRSPLQTIAIGGLALGGASVAASGITALLAQSKCADGHCAARSDQDTYDPLRTAAIVTFWAGAALAVGSGVLLWAAPSSAETKQQLSWYISPLGAGVRGAL